MGYYTQYELKTNDQSNINHVVGVARQACYNPFEDACKWHSHDQVMKNYSERYRDILFELRGVGEDHPDIWLAFYKNGKSYKIQAEIKYAAFDEGLLK